MFFSSALSDGIHPILSNLTILGSALSVLLFVIGGYLYITSSGNIEKLNKAKKIIKNTIIGLVIILSANTFSNFLGHTFTSNKNPKSQELVLQNIKPEKHNSGIVEVIIKTITGVFADISASIASPFLHAFGYFLSGSPLPSQNPNVFKLWGICVTIADSLFILFLVLMGLHFMSFSVLGFSELTLTKLIGQFTLGFIIINTSIFIIDVLIQISNLIIKSLGSNYAETLINNLEDVIKGASGYSLAAMLILIAFLILSIILIIYYLTRIVTIYLGAILAPFIVLLALLPITRDIAISLSKKYFVNVYILIVHIVILELAGSLLASMGNTNVDPLLSIVLGIATLLTLLKAQGVVNQLSYVSIVPRYARQFSQQLVYSLSYLGGQAVGLVANNSVIRSTAGAIADIGGTPMNASDYQVKTIVQQKAREITNNQANHKYDSKGHIKK